MAVVAPVLLIALVSATLPELPVVQVVDVPELHDQQFEGHDEQVVVVAAGA